MNFKDIEKLIEMFSQKKIAKLSLKEGEFELSLEQYSQTTQAPQATQLLPQAPTSNYEPLVQAPQTQTSSNKNQGLFIESPMVGTFYRCPSPNAAPYINVGDKVKKGQIIGIVEAMKIMNEIEAEFDCTIVEIVASDAQPVEFGSKLVKVEKI